MKKTSILRSAFLSLIALGPISAHAASITLDFSTADQYDNNFVEPLGPSLIGHNSANQNVLFTSLGAGGNTSSIRYDTNPSNGLVDNPNYLTETVSATVTYSTLSDASFGLYARLQPNSLGILGLVNVAGSNLQLRLFSGANHIDANAGTTFFNATFNLTNGTFSGSTGGTGSTNTFTTSTPLNIALTQTDAADPVFSLTVSDADGLIATTGLVAFTANDNYNSAGSVGARLYGFVSGTSITMDNFFPTAIPEPSTALLSALGALALLLRRR